MESYSNRLHRHSRPEPVRQANTLSDYTLEQILELKFNDREKYIPIQTFDQWIRAKVADQLRKTVSADVETSMRDACANPGRFSHAALQTHDTAATPLQASAWEGETRFLHA